MKRFSTVVGMVALLGMCGLLWGCESDIDKANALAKAGQRDEATKLFDKVLKTQKTDKAAVKAAYMGLASIHCSPGNYNGLRCLEAADALQKAGAKDAKVTSWLKRALYTSAYNRTTSGLLIKASEYLKRYLALEPNDAKAHFIGAMIHERQGRKPVDPDELLKAIKSLDKVIKTASKTDTMKLDPKDKNPTPLKWEAAKMKGNLYDEMLKGELLKFMKSPAAKKKGATFKPNAAHLKGAIDAFALAHSLNSTQPDKAKHFYPLFQTGMLHINYKKDIDGAIAVLLKAEKEFPKSREVLSILYRLYKRKMAEVKGRGRRARKQKKELKKKADAYLAKVANLPKPRPKPRK